MLTADHVLGIAEFALVSVSLLWLTITAVSRRRERLLRATALAAVVAVTVAQPFGVVASRASGIPKGATTVKHPAHVHILRLGVVPIEPFKLYKRQEFYLDDPPPDTLRARSWAWLPLLVNSSKLADICGYGNPPCWDDQEGQHLVVLRKDHHYWVAFTERRSETAPSILDETGGAWKLGFGLASPLGLAYWAVVMVLVLVGVGGLRGRARRT
jgi:hypothetical protein